MQIINSNIEDLPRIFELYKVATEFMISKNQVPWPKFSEDLIVDEISNLKQWKLVDNNKIACIWATTLNDALIWGADNAIPSLYLHRIATDPGYRGQALVSHVIEWADNYCKQNALKYVRLDTVGLNKGLIGHYKKLGMDFLGIKELENTKGLPDHYSKGPVCLFQREIFLQ